MSSFSNLPKDIINQIMVYTGAVKYRNGRYMQQIPKTDERYAQLKTIPKPMSYYMLGSHGLQVILEENKQQYHLSKMIRIEFDFANRQFLYRYRNLLCAENETQFACPMCE